MMTSLKAILAISILTVPVLSADAPAPKPAARPPVKPASTQPVLPKPTLEDVHYGPHAKQVINFWKAESNQPTPMLLFIHGGGWMAGNRTSGLGGLLQEMLK